MVRTVKVPKEAWESWQAVVAEIAVLSEELLDDAQLARVLCTKLLPVRSRLRSRYVVL